MAITNTQQARQMYNEGSKKPVTQAGVKNFLGKQEMVTAPKFWLSEPDHVKAKLAYITDEEEKILIDKNLYGSLKGKPNKGPAGLPSLQGGDAGGLGGDGPSGDDSGGDARSDHMGSKGKQGPPGGLSDQSRGDLEAMSRGLRSSLAAQSRAAALGNLKAGVKNIFDKTLIGRSLNMLGKAFGPKGPTNPYSGGRTGLHSDYGTTDDDDNVGGGDGMPLYAQLGYPSQEAYMAAMRLATQPPAGLPAAVQPMQTMDLNRIAYRFMADGGFLDDEIDERQAYGLGSIVRKITRPIKKVVKKATRAVKKVAKSPIGRLAIAVAAPYALGPAMANAQFLAGLSAAQKAAIISGATTGITQLASGEDLDFKDIALSAALSGGISKLTTPAVAGGVDPSSAAGRARVASDISAGAIPDRAMGQIGTRAPAFTGPAELGMTTRQAAAPSVFTRPTMADVGVKGMPSVKQSGLEKLIASSRRGLGKIKDSKLTDILLRNDEGKLSPLKLASLAGLAGLATAKGVGQEEELQEMDRGEGIDIAAIRRRPFDYLAPRFAGSEFDFYAAEGGQAKKEPVAKKVMPLLDLEGQEMDFRQDGGFVPIGRMEKADDVPARLSKNEFVFTAEAVRNAGEGDIDKGAEVMYNMMKNLESGGEVSEESQGLEGARKMFQTSQRLEEVL